jgi:hypothetical protein
LHQQTREVITEVEAAEALPRPRIQLWHTLPLQHSSPLHAVILVADATSRPERASHRTMRRRRFVNLALLLLIARLRAVAS